MLRFGNEELGAAMESDFFAASTPGHIREYFVSYLLPPGSNLARHQIYNEQHRQTLAIRILTKAIDQVVKSENSDLEFIKYRGGTPRKIQGRIAILRHLLTYLCASISYGNLSEKDSNVLLKFADNLAKTGEAFKVLKETEDYRDLDIEKDLKTLVRFVKGKAKVRDFSHFYPHKSMERRGLKH